MENIKNVEKNVGITKEDIIKVENEMKITFPDMYKEILEWSNGCVINDRVLIYASDEIKERNETMEVEEYANSYVAIGDDGGGLVILMLQDKSTREAILVDIGDMDPADPYCTIGDIYEWMLAGCIIK